MANEKRLSTTAQIMEHLQISKATLFRLVMSGKIKHIKVGRLLRFDIDNLFDTPNR